MTDSLQSIVSKVNGSMEFKEVGMLDGLNFYQVNIPELRKNPYVFVEHSDGHVSKVLDKYRRDVQEMRYKFGSIWLTLGKAHTIAQKSSESFQLPTQDQGSKPKSTVVRVTSEEKDSKILAYLRSIAENKVARATYAQIGENVGLSGPVVKSRVKVMMNEGRLKGWQVRGQGGIYVV